MASQPHLPSRDECDVHEAMGHTQFRCWCEACVYGQGREDLHLRGEKWRTLPVVSYDYAFLGKQDAKEDGKVSSEGTKLLIGKDSKPKVIFVHATPHKGISHGTWNFERVNGDLQKLGYRQLVLKSDKHFPLWRRQEKRSESRGVWRSWTNYPTRVTPRAMERSSRRCAP